ncbi:MAG: hypothetical protein ACRDG4_11485, partial [Chloroflexota bacterium]
LRFYAVLSVLMLGAPFTENMHLTWLLPGIGILLVIIAQQPHRPRHMVGFIAFLMLALPLAEKVSWGAGANLGGRFASGMDCYGLTALCIVLCLVAFGSARRPGALS